MSIICKLIGHAPHFKNCKNRQNNLKHCKRCDAALKIDYTRKIDRLICWWFGCYSTEEKDWRDQSPYSCDRCGKEDIGYERIKRKTLHNRFVTTLSDIRYSKPIYRVYPPKCPHCEKRFCQEKGHGIPF